MRYSWLIYWPIQSNRPNAYFVLSIVTTSRFQSVLIFSFQGTDGILSTRQLVFLPRFVSFFFFTTPWYLCKINLLRDFLNFFFWSVDRKFIRIAFGAKVFPVLVK